MDQTFQALGGILLKAIPTAVLLLVLYFYLKAMMFGPLAKIMKERDALTKGARKTAEQSLARADERAQEFETKLRDARGEVYKENEEIRKKWIAEQSVHIQKAKVAAEGSIQSSKTAIAQEAATAKQNLTDQSTALAEQIATAVLSPRHTHGRNS
jgi:F-type H+-transporting ATPase subunit b